MKFKGLLVIAALVVSTAAAFWPVLQGDFVNFDDEQYVTDNPRVRQGLTWENVGWAFTTREAANWHPVTWLSHMLDVRLHGLEPRGHHLTSLLLHLANACLLFVALRGLTGALWKSAFAAALFALHPLHVESVAWVAERKDVLCAFFSLLALVAWSRNARRPAAGWYLATLALFALALMAKPMAVTLPLLLLILDWWPLGRVPWPQGGAVRRGLTAGTGPLLEKAPLLLLSAALAAVTLAAQSGGGAVRNADFPLHTRLFNAVTACAQYLWRTLWPRDLAVFYPHPGDGLPWWQVAGAGALLVAASAGVVRARRRQPYLLAGWLWFLVALLPVLGLVQVGRQATADRYTYLPLVGVFVMVSWGVPRPLGGWRGRGPALALTALAALTLLGFSAHRQAGVWRDSLTLFTQAARATRDNWLAEYNLGLLLSRRGDVAGASARYRDALRIRPDYAEAHNNLGVILAAERRFEEAAWHFQEALRRQPLMSRLEIEDVLVNLGNVLQELGRLDEAASRYREARRIAPSDPVPVYCLGLVEFRRGDPQAAEALFREALRLNPGYRDAARALAELLLRSSPPGR